MYGGMNGTDEVRMALGPTNKQINCLCSYIFSNNFAWLFGSGYGARIIQFAFISFNMAWHEQVNNSEK
jgi:hypothetical protein